MAFKFMCLALLVASASAGIAPIGPAYSAYSAPLSYAAPQAYAPAAYAPAAYAQAAYAPALAHTKAIITKEYNAEHDPHPQYSYAYNVEDALTGDYKSQQETRDGDRVEGSYSLLEADGTRRIVEYTADAHNGFNAVVRKEGFAAPIAAPIAKVAAPLAYAPAIPTVAKFAAPAFARYAPAPVLAPAPLAYSSGPAPLPAQPLPFATRFAEPSGLITKYAEPANFYKYAPANPIATYGAPIAPIAGPAVIQKTLGLSHVSYSSPLVSYTH